MTESSRTGSVKPVPDKSQDLPETLQSRLDELFCTTQRSRRRYRELESGTRRVITEAEGRLTRRRAPPGRAEEPSRAS